MSKDAPPPSYRRTLTGFEPVSDTARRFWRETKPGAIVKLDGKRPRNLARHNYYWKLLTVVVDNMDRFSTPDQLHYAVKQALRMGEFIPIRGGKEVVFVPESTSFASMSEPEFAEFLDKVANMLGETLGVPPHTLLEETRQAA